MRQDVPWEAECGMRQSVVGVPSKVEKDLLGTPPTLITIFPQPQHATRATQRCPTGAVYHVAECLSKISNILKFLA